MRAFVFSRLCPLAGGARIKMEIGEFTTGRPGQRVDKVVVLETPSIGPRFLLGKSRNALRKEFVRDCLRADLWSTSTREP